MMPTVLFGMRNKRDDVHKCTAQLRIRIRNVRGSQSRVVIVITTIYQVESLKFCFPKHFLEWAMFFS